MAQRQTIPFVGGVALSKSVQVSNQMTVNLVQSLKGRGAKAPVVLESAPGLVDIAACGNGPCRSPTMKQSLLRGTMDLYGVYGTKLMAQTVAAGNIEIGTLNANLTPHCTIAVGRDYLMVVDGVDGYTYDGTTFAQISDPDFPGVSAAAAPTHCLYLDGFFIVNDALTDNWFISALEDPTDWNALDFEAAAVDPDRALAAAATESLLWIVGEGSAQAYYNSGNPDFPYEIVLSATQEVGILAPYSIAESDDGIFYLATTPEGGTFIYQIQGQAGRVITGNEQEAILAGIKEPQRCYGFIYKQAGESFYVLQAGEITWNNQTRDSATLLYNIRAKDWEVRALQDLTGWRAAGHGVLATKNVVGSRLAARNYRLDLENYQDAGTDMVRYRRSQVYHVNGLKLDWHAFVADLQVGDAALGVEAGVRLRYSDDGGRNWSAFLEGSAGSQGETQRRIRFTQLGSSRNRIYELWLTGNAPGTIIAAYGEFTVLRE